MKFEEFFWQLADRWEYPLTFYPWDWECLKWMCKGNVDEVFYSPRGT